MDDDGVNHFGTHTDQPEAAHWDTPEWREEMRGLYGDGGSVGIESTETI